MNILLIQQENMALKAANKRLKGRILFLENELKTRLSNLEKMSLRIKSIINKLKEKENL